MYEQYTDEQIVEMLGNKLKKLGYDTIANNPEHYPDACKLISTLYKSGYIRGQLGRSFIIGEKKQEKWVPANKDNVKVGSKVRYLNAEKHKCSPVLYSEPGTVGEVMKVCSGETCRVQWSCFYTSLFVRWFDLEVLLCE